MSVYLSRSPYLTSYGAGGARKRSLFQRKPRLTKARKSQRLWDAQASFSGVASRTKKRSGTSIFASLRQQTRVGAKVTGNVLVKSAETFSGMAHAMKDVGTKKVRFEIGPKMVIGSLLGMVFLLSFAYLAHFHTMATKGYELRRLEAARQQLLNQYEIKNMKLAEMQSLNTIANSERASAMRRVNQVEFVRGNTALAVNP